jgi:hypothetical protein
MTDGWPGRPRDKRPIEGVPEFVCEILSPSNARYDRLTKTDLYARFGVAFYWLIDPVEATLEAFELRAGAWLRLGGWTRGDAARIRPFRAHPSSRSGGSSRQKASFHVSNAAQRRRTSSSK